MLSLDPPFNIINGVSLLPDHLDKLHYYYQPINPNLSFEKDATTGKRIPKIQVIKYRGRAGNGGSLSFDVNLGIEQSALDDIKAELKRIDRLPAQPRLSPVPLVDGSVKMMLFGAQSGDTPPGDATGPKFVLKINHNVKPELYGHNQAAFSVQLDQEGVTMLEKALQGEMSPIGVVYSLDYLGLRSAYAVRLNVDWDRVQKHMDEHFGASGFFSSVEIDKAVDELVDKRVIVLEADTFVPEGEDASGIISRRDQALNEVRDMITNAFFEPSLNPVKPAQDGWDRASFVAQRASSIATTGGWGAVASFSYRKMDYKRMDRKILNVTMSERTTVKRSIYPQGHLTGLFRVLKQEGLDPQGFIIPVDLDDKWFERRRVEVSTGANFEEDAIGSVNVSLRYGNEPKNVILGPTAAKKSVDWGSIITNDAMQWEVPYSYKVTFKGVDSTERPVTLTSAEQKVTVENLEITPRELYSIVPIPIMALPPFPWKRFPNVEVQTRYTDEAHGIRISDSFLLNEQEQEKTWKLFIIDPQRKQFQYKLVYRAANNKDITMPWVTTDAEQIIVRDPYPQKRTLLVVPLFNWDLVERAFVDVSYTDKPNGVSESQSFEFNIDDVATQSFSVDLHNPDARLVAYQVTVLFRDGHMAEVPQSFTRQNRVIIRDDMKGHKIALVRPVAGDFAKKKAKKMTVELRYEDAANGLSFNDVFNFDEQSLNGLAYFEYDYADKLAYEYRTTVRFLNGMSKVTTWQKTSLDELIVPIN